MDTEIGKMDDAALGAEIARLREQREQIRARLSVLVHELDDRLALRKLKESNPRLAQRIEAVGIGSQESVNGVRV